MESLDKQVLGSLEGAPPSQEGELAEHLHRTKEALGKLVTTDHSEELTVKADPVDPNEPVIIPFCQSEPSGTPITEQVYAPDNEAAKSRLSGLVVRAAAGIKLTMIEDGLTLDEAFQARVVQIKEHPDMDDSARELASAVLDQAYHAVKMNPPKEGADATPAKALRMIANGELGDTFSLLKTAQERAANISAIATKTKSASTKARRNKNKVAKKSRRNQRKKK